MRAALALMLCLAAAPLQAEVTVTFTEGAPTDRFAIVTTATCLTGPLEIGINLAGSPAGLIFDTTGAGAGVEVFQPLVLVAGGDLVTGITALRDGDRAVTLRLAALPPGQVVAFTTDLDDTVGQRETIVSGAEIAGATASLRGPDGAVTAPFGADGVARLATPPCTS